MFGQKKQNVFAREIEEAVAEQAALENQMDRCLEKITAETGLNSEQISAMENLGLTFDIGDYVLAPTTYCSKVGDGWTRGFLMAYPKAIGNKVGWSNVPHDEFPEGWMFYAGGTATIVYPLPHVLKDILQAIKRHRRMNSG